MLYNDVAWIINIRRVMNIWYTIIFNAYEYIYEQKKKKMEKLNMYIMNAYEYEYLHILQALLWKKKTM